MKLNALLATLLLTSTSAFGAIENARIHQRIFPTLDVKRLSDMYFPDAFPGSPAFTIEPGTSETAQNASFAVVGESGKRVTVILPNSKVHLENRASKDKIFVSNFKSSTGQTAVLDRNGELRIYVGATREDIPARIPSGDYTGTFVVTVMY